MGAAKPSQGDDDGSVTIRLGNDLAHPITFTPDAGDFQEAAMRWSYVARSRERWRAGGSVPGQGRDNPLFAHLEPHLRRLADAGVAEVSVPGSASEQDGWAHRVFPWEYVLTAATREQRSEPLFVTRHLRGTPGSGGTFVDLAHPATIESSPGPLRAYYNTQLEGDMVCEALGLAKTFKQRLRDPQCNEARAWVERTPQPTLLHLAGVDTHQAIELLGLERQYPSRERRDGFAFRDDAGGIDLADADRLADVVCAGARKPDLVLCNFYNSASRLASRIVAKGAGAAIGYHDVIDDNLAMLFSTTLYRQLAHGTALLEAFKRALNTALQQESMRGAGIVLWSSVPLVGTQPPTKARPSTSLRVKPPRHADKVKARERIRVSVAERPLMNYSLLHNGLSPLRELKIERKNVTGLIRDIRIEVELHAGDTAFPFRATVELPAEKEALLLGDQVVLPLTSALIRTQSERIQSSLRVTVHCSGELVEERTFRVALAPVDEWQDGEIEEWRLLPSFVLPRDPAVQRVIESAHAILCALADDPAAGFDGYQSVDENATDIDAKYGCVDKQVRAIWYAVLNQHGLTYINPPPSYGSGTQRLRTPSQLLEERRGTCIDLALLMAACLEYVGFWPVLFLLRGHAFVGYWRSEKLRDLFLRIEDVSKVVPEGEDAESGTRSARPQRGGVFGADQRLDVQRRINQGHLVPLETTWLTARGSFDAAAEEGRRNVRSVAEYQAMIDLKIARDAGVTPLPLLGGAR